MIPAEKVIVALDTQDDKKVDALFRALAGEKVWIKIGMEAFYTFGPDVVFDAHDKGFKIFLDLKLHDIPNTVANGLKTLARLPVDMLNVHAAGGKEMMMKSVEALSTGSKRPLLIAVTQLTSTSQTQMQNEQKIACTLEESVLNYARLTQAAGFDGVVSSPLEVAMIKKELGKKFLTVTPGIRPLENSSDDQKRITTPLAALKLGTDYMVIGRPITASADPKLALKNILEGR
jgi:orotidine-5'-phosphate decarboxylase